MLREEVLQQASTMQATKCLYIFSPVVFYKENATLNLLQK